MNPARLVFRQRATRRAGLCRRWRHRKRGLRARQLVASPNKGLENRIVCIGEGRPARRSKRPRNRFVMPKALRRTLS